MAGYRTAAIVAPEKSYPAFSGERPKCSKCTHEGITMNRWQPDEKVILRQCLDCTYTWKELPADAG